VVFEISKGILKGKTPFERTKLTVEKLKKEVENKEVKIEKRELRWLDIMESQIEDVADDELEYYEQIKDDLDTDKFLPKEYGLE
jgi:methanol--5-hydroxybenzimidazolylcobamide Co-methyltransferase